jgi:hypothetical protein
MQCLRRGQSGRVHGLGKTLPPYSDLLEQERRREAPFKKALPKTDQAIVDRLFDCAQRQVQAGVYASRRWALGTFVLAVLSEHEKLLEQGRMRLEAVSSRRHHSVPDGDPPE